MAPPLTLTIAGSRPASPDDGERLDGEGLVEFDDADVVQLESGERERFGDGDDGPDAHDFRRNARGGEADQTRHRG